MRVAQTALRVASVSVSLGGSASRRRPRRVSGAIHLVLQHFGEDGRLFEEDLHVHEARVLILTNKKMMIMFVSRTPIPRNDAHGIGVAARRDEAPVLEGAAEVMTNEGHGLGEAEEGAMGGSSGKLDAL